DGLRDWHIPCIPPFDELGHHSVANIIRLNREFRTVAPFLGDSCRHELSPYHVVADCFQRLELLRVATSFHRSDLRRNSPGAEWVRRPISVQRGRGRSFSGAP